MHTRGGNFDASKRGWLSTTLEENEQAIVEIINKAAGKSMDILLTTIINKAQSDLSKN
jgi:hypothetical protein